VTSDLKVAGKTGIWGSVTGSGSGKRLNHPAEGTAEVVDFELRCIPLIHKQDATPLRGFIDLTKVGQANSKSKQRTKSEHGVSTFTLKTKSEKTDCRNTRYAIPWPNCRASAEAQIMATDTRLRAAGEVVHMEVISCGCTPMALALEIEMSAPWYGQENDKIMRPGPTSQSQ